MTMAKVRELLNFEKIKEVIDIDAISDKQARVEKYVISKDMQEYLAHLIADINAPQHKAAQIVGGYGSGKSHLLAFLISILTEPDLRQYIQDKELRELAQQIKRDFVIIHWELQPNDVDLSQYFYFEVTSQLASKYAIDFDFKTEGVVDHKKNILDLLDKIKADDPSRGLVVIMDEISDFIKQKDKEKITRDMQFMRVLGQVAQSSDFTFIGAMQEPENLKLPRLAG
jgi:ABC-type cobalamin/Fe3+-siderophores transport system ATPase subunit